MKIKGNDVSTVPCHYDQIQSRNHEFEINHRNLLKGVQVCSPAMYIFFGNGILRTVKF